MTCNFSDNKSRIPSSYTYRSSPGILFPVNVFLCRLGMKVVALEPSKVEAECKRAQEYLEEVAAKLSPNTP